MAQPTHRFILKWSKMITPSVLHLGFTREDNLALPFVAGQFITLHIEGPQKTLHRSYSLANTPHQSDNVIEIACAKVEGGVASNLLFNMKPGEVVSASGPYGLFVLKEETPARYILIATGTGVTPYRSMLNEIKSRLENLQTGLEVILVLGVRYADDLLFKEDFLNFAKAHPKFKFYACYSQEKKSPLESFERLGRVQDTFKELNLEPTRDIVYLCGNPNMIDNTFALLTELGFDRKNVRREKYLFSH